MLGARASLYTAVASEAEAEAHGGLYAVTIGMTRAVARRLMRRTVLPAWREQWAKRGVECDGDAPAPTTALLALPTPSLLSTWPSTAAVAAAATTAPPAADAASLALVGEAPTARDGAREIVVLLLAGLPGTTLPELAAGATELTAGSAHWLRAPDASSWCSDDGRCDAAALARALSAAVAEASSDAGGSTPNRVLVTTRGFVEMPAAARAVLDACARVTAAAAGAARVVLGAACACLDAPRATEAWAADGDGRCAPGVLELLDDGYTQAVVVCHTAEMDGAAEATLNKLLSSASPHAALIRAPRGPRQVHPA